MMLYLEKKFKHLNSFTRAAIIYISALTTLLVVYHNILNYGFDYDDNHQVRPYTLKEISEAFYAKWDASEIEREFYRPLTIVFYAARFEILGYNVRYYHILSILMAAAVLLLFYYIIYRISGKVSLAGLALLLFAVYPYLAHSAIAWSTNQMHILTILFFLIAWYILVRKGPMLNRKLAIYLTILQVVIFLIKEDGILLMPTLFCIAILDQFIQTSSIKIEKKQWLYWLYFLLLIISLFFLRCMTMQKLGGYQTISLVNIPRTIYHIATFQSVVKHYSLEHFLVTRYAQAFVCLIPIFGIAALIKLEQDMKKLLIRLLVIGIIIFSSFNLLTVFSTKIYQWHMQSLGHTIILLAFIYAIIRSLRRFTSVIRYATVLIITTGFIACAVSSHILSTMFAPFSYQTIQHDKRVLEWWDKIPNEHKERLQEKMENPLWHRFDD
ncbi:hypothetical protein JXO59_03105 [candidate division KSB1 bacterium]|nr:hypothetical protein [candidate division KSB1 bacterium]